MATSPHPSPPTHPARHHRARNAGLGVLGGLLLVIVIVGVCEIVEWPFLRHPLEKKLSQVMARPVTFGDEFGVRFLGSLRAHTNALVIGPGAPGAPTLVDDKGQPRDFMRADSVKLALTYHALWDQYKATGAPMQIRLLDVDGLELNLKRDADGHANWQFGAAQPATAASSPGLPQFEHLNVRNGQVRMEDVPLQVAADVHVTTHEGTALPTGPAASATAPQLRVAAGASAALPASSGASGPTVVAIDDDTPGLRVDGKGSYRKQPLVIQLRSSGLLPMAASDAAAPAVPLWLDVHAGKSSIRLDGTATDLLHFGGMDASFKASGPSLAAVGDALGVTLPTTAEFSTNGRIRKDGAVYSADVASMAIGSSRLRGNFKFDSAPAVPVLSGTLAGSRLAIADLAPAFGAATPDTPSPTKSDKMLPEREFDIPSLKAMNADVGIALDVLDLGTEKLEPFAPVKGQITLRDGVLNVHDLLARTSAGQVQGAIGLDSRPALPAWNADLRWSGIQLERFITLRDIATKKNAQGERPDTGYISGALGGAAQLKGTGKSTAALLASLDGKTRLWVRDGQVSHIVVEAAGIDVAQALGVYIKGDDKMPMQCAVAQLGIVNGKVTPEVGVIETHDTTILVSGDLSLADETLGLRMTSHPHDFSPLALRSPVKVDGTFSDPHVHLEAKPLLLRAGAAGALALINPLASLLALVDFKQADRDECTSAVRRVSGATQGTASASAPVTAAPAKAAARPRQAATPPNARSSH